MIFFLRPAFAILFLFFFNQAHTQKSSDSLKDLATKSEVRIDEDLSLELGSEKMILITKKSIKLLSSPGNSGKVIGKIKKGIKVQQLDIIGTYILICYNGQCGYIPEDALLRKKVQKKESKTSQDSIPSLKSNKT